MGQTGSSDCVVSGAETGSRARSCGTVATCLLLKGWAGQTPTATFLSEITMTCLSSSLKSFGSSRAFLDTQWEARQVPTELWFPELSS